MTAVFKVLSKGAGVTIQDLGRAGWRRFGVSPGGAMDAVAMMEANRLVGNCLDAPVLEVLLQGARVECLVNCWVGIAGADLVEGFASGTARRVQAGEVLVFNQSGNGMWVYLAVPGGLEGVRNFGSVSVDARVGLGSECVKGAILSTEGNPCLHDFVSVVRRVTPPSEVRYFKPTESFELLKGPQFDAFPAVDRAALVADAWSVSARSDRTGYRLEGALLQYSKSTYSEPVLPGSFQVTSDGRVIVTLAYGPTVGGYPKLALLQEKDIARFVQCRPGTKLKFKWKK
jgi:biotin-dependent carboxylase-like uncharacterized protein